MFAIESWAGKTSISSALAVELASDYEKDLKVVIVSTDPAHSLGDALDVDLRSGNGRPVVSCLDLFLFEPRGFDTGHLAELNFSSAYNHTSLFAIR